MPIVMLLYYIICFFILFTIGWNLYKEKNNKNDFVLYLIVALPLILRLLRIK